MIPDRFPDVHRCQLRCSLISQVFLPIPVQPHCNLGQANVWPEQAIAKHAALDRFGVNPVKGTEECGDLIKAPGWYSFIPAK